jgi:hypothetical protein
MMEDQNGMITHISGHLRHALNYPDRNQHLSKAQKSFPECFGVRLPFIVRLNRYHWHQASKAWDVERRNLHISITTSLS